jgi:hypothetical protein
MQYPVDEGSSDGRREHAADADDSCARVKSVSQFVHRRLSRSQYVASSLALPIALRTRV